MPVDKAPALRKAAKVIADEAIRRALHIALKYPTGKTAKSVQTRVYASASKAVISAGGPAAPMANMFEKEGSRHPVFANRHKTRAEWTWTGQPYRPFLEEAAEVKADEAMKVFADDIIDKMLRDSGL